MLRKASKFKKYIAYVTVVGAGRVAFRFHPNPQRLKAVANDTRRRGWPKDIPAFYLRDPERLINAQHLFRWLEIGTANGRLENDSVITSVEVLPNDSGGKNE